MANKWPIPHRIVCLASRFSSFGQFSIQINQPKKFPIQIGLSLHTSSSLFRWWWSYSELFFGGDDNNNNDTNFCYHCQLQVCCVIALLISYFSTTTKADKVDLSVTLCCSHHYCHRHQLCPKRVDFEYYASTQHFNGANIPIIVVDSATLKQRTE